MSRPAVAAGPPDPGCRNYGIQPSVSAALDTLRHVRGPRDFAIALCWLRGQEIAARRDGRADVAAALAGLFDAFIAGVACGRT